MLQQQIVRGDKQMFQMLVKKPKLNTLNNVKNKKGFVYFI